MALIASANRAGLSTRSLYNSIRRGTFLDLLIPVLSFLCNCWSLWYQYLRKRWNGLVCYRYLGLPNPSLASLIAS